jgi:hypothetical protein
MDIFLEQWGMGHYVKIFQERRISLKVLSVLQEPDLHILIDDLADGNRKSKDNTIQKTKLHIIDQLVMALKLEEDCTTRWLPT